MAIPSTPTSTADPGIAPPSARVDVARWVAPLFGLLGVVVFGLWYWNPGYRYDEYLVAVSRTGLPWDELWKIITTTDPGPGPLYILMKPWSAVSSDPLWTRIPSVLAMAVAVAALVALVKRAINPRTAVFAGLLMLALPANSRWAQDNRMYALAAMCTVLAVALWFSSLQRHSRWWSVGYGAAVVGMGLFHLYTLTVIPVLFLAAFWVAGPRKLTMIKTLVPPAIAVVVLAPHIYLNLKHPTGSPTNPPLSLHSVSAIAFGNFGGRLVTVLLAVLAVGGAIWAWRTPKFRAIVILGLGWAVFPMLIFMIARGVGGVPTLVARYYLFAIPGTALLAALGLAALWDWWKPAAVIVIVIVVALLIPQQFKVRAAGSHSVSTHRMGELLTQPELAGLPIVALNPQFAAKVNASTYPEKVLSPTAAPAQPVAVVVGGNPMIAAADVVYLAPGSAWVPVVRCTLGSTGTVEVVATAQTKVPTGSPSTLARQLNSAVPGSHCVGIQ
ncbi:MAG: glycosyltransferase family 39 protein [Actinomycetes bacterium]